MIKPVLSTALVLLCLLLIKANIDTFRASPAQLAETPAASSEKRSRTLRPPAPLNLNPRLNSQQLPDLHSGYIFNTERFLAKESRQTKTGKGYGQNIRMEDVVFNGAIIGPGFTKALVSYQTASRQTPRPIRSAPTGAVADQARTVQLEVDDQLGGYTVQEITADFILFSKGSDTIKKPLFDIEKERQQVAPQPTPATHARPTPKPRPVIPTRPVPARP
ncbi:MAG: hypothetical protein C0613_00895 [Desulfobulbaceae bacterium]|nr:MAG: hypothetical protein C0613_00895 [Desulfobulbaceae bacterium]